MKYLLDTQCIIWFLEGNPRLPEKTKEIIIDTGNDIYYSCVSVWEITIKISIGKLKLKHTLQEIIKKLEHENIQFLNYKHDYVFTLSLLPFFHRDPFDRYILAQSIVEKISVISNDEAFDLYDIKRI